MRATATIYDDAPLQRKLGIYESHSRIAREITGDRRYGRLCRLAGGRRGTLPRKRPVGRRDDWRDVCARRAPRTGQARPRARGRATHLRGAARALPGPRCRLRRCRPATWRTRVGAVAEHSRICRQLPRAYHDRRHPSDGAARPPPCRGAPFPARFQRDRLLDSGRRRRLRLPRHGHSDAGGVPRAEARTGSRRTRSRSVGDGQPTALATSGHAAKAGRRGDDAPFGWNDFAVEVDPAHTRRLRAQRAAVRRRCGLQRSHGVHGHPATGTQLQPGVAGHAGGVLLRRHGGALLRSES